MTLHISAYGRLTKSPKSISTATGTAMAACYIAIKIDPNDKNVDEVITEFCDLLAFGKVAEQLMRHDVGDSLSVMGNVKYKEYNGKRQLVIMADSLVSAKTVRPSNGSHKKPFREGNSKPKQKRPSPEAVRNAMELLNVDAMAKQSNKAGHVLPFDDEFNI